MEKIKTSNKIFTIFLSIVAFYFLVFAMDLRLFGIHRNDRVYPEQNKHVIPLKGFKYLKLENVRIEIISSDSNFIQVSYSSDTSSFRHLPDSMLYKFEPVYKGDTIYLSGFPNAQSNASKILDYNGCKIFTNNNIETLSAINTTFRLSKFKADSIDLILNNSSLNGAENSSFGKLDVRAFNKSRINVEAPTSHG